MSQPTRDLARYVEVASKAAHAAGAVLRYYFAHERIPFQFKNNDPSNVVTPVDDEAQAAAMAVIAAAVHPTFIVGEESLFSVDESGKPTESKGLGYDEQQNWQRPPHDSYWLIDGLDGTMNFLHHIPFFCASVAYVENHRPIVGVCYAPLLGELFTAYLDGPVLLNGQPVKVADAKNLEGRVIGTDSPDRIDFGATAPKGLATRRLGSPILTQAYVACGRLDAYAYSQAKGREQRLGPWDLAAGRILVERAGGTVLSPGGDPADIWARGVVEACSEEVQQLLVPAVKV